MSEPILAGTELVQITVDGEAAHCLSIELLEQLQHSEVDLAVAALAMTLGRILVDDPTKLTPDQEIRFIAYIMEQASLYMLGSGKAAN